MADTAKPVIAVTAPATTIQATSAAGAAVTFAATAAANAARDTGTAAEWFERATGQDDRLDEDYLAGALAGMQARAEMIRASGQFGEQQPVPDDASVQERFFAFIGRDPRWTPPARSR